MSKIYLVTRPEHDDTTTYLSKWCEETISLAHKKGFKVLDLDREKAVKEEFTNRVNKLEPNLIVLNGHGDENTVTGHKNQPVVIQGENEHLLKDKIIYAISCSSAKSLGMKSVENGAISYTGYDDDFVFLYEPFNSTKPLSDETARIFLEHSNIFIESIIKGNTIKISKQRAEKKLRENILKFLGSNEYDTNFVRFLWWDLRHFVSHGNLDATI